MKLGEFIKKFVEHNSLVRLLYKDSNGNYEIVGQSWDSVSMEHEVLNAQGKFRHYIGNNVIGVTDILTGGPYSEAVNIVIERLDDQPFVEERARDINPQSEAVCTH